MALPSPPLPDPALNLALAVIASSSTPLLILDGDLTVIAASTSFCRAFDIDPATVAGSPIHALGGGEWEEPRLRSLLTATASANVAVSAYEMDLEIERLGTRRIVLNAHKLDYADKDNVRLLLSVSDVTELRIAEKFKDDLVRDKAILVREMQHRIANSLQIIASLIMQSARNVQSDDSRLYLHAAHDRVISIAAVQRHLAGSGGQTVKLRSYFTQLCQSLSASMIGDHSQLTIEVRADETSVDGDTSVSLGLIVTELVINTLKHAFPQGRSGKIVIDYASRGPDWTLSVSDDGIGMPDKSDPGLGTSIIDALARQLRARIIVAPAFPGTIVSLVHVHVAASDKGGNVAQLKRGGVSAEAGAGGPPRIVTD